MRVVVEAHQQASGERSTHDLAARHAWCVALLPARANAPAGARTHVPTWPDSRFAIVYVVSHDESRFRCSGRAQLLAPDSEAMLCPKIASRPTLVAHAFAKGHASQHTLATREGAHRRQALAQKTSSAAAAPVATGRRKKRSEIKFSH